MEDIKRNYEERHNRHTKDRILRSRINHPIRVTRMGYRTFTVYRLTPLEVKHRIVYEQDIQRICRSMLGLTQTGRHKDIK